MSEEQQVVLVTGASSGIGAATAALLAERGHRVFGTSRTPRADAAPGDVEMIALEVGSDASVAACVDALLERAGRVDVLVNNAGVALFGESEATSMDQARAQLETNFLGAVRMINAVLPSMRAQGRGRIINVSSLAGLTGVPLMSLYSASKYALEGYSESLRYELRDLGIAVTLIEPGWVTTRLLRSAQVASAPVSAYDRVRSAARAGVGDRLAAGIPPARVAEAILGAIRDPRPRLRYRVGRDAAWIPRVKAIAPPARFEASTRKLFRLDAPPEVPAGPGGTT
jgi:NAD(P)-dependent dehydrogenase (short-subunit alcohol dehydrogenase family)